jgi:hypothetical protein
MTMDKALRPLKQLSLVLESRKTVRWVIVPHIQETANELKPICDTFGACPQNVNLPKR